MLTSYRNIAILFTVILGFVFIAFFKTYFGLFPYFKNTTNLVHLHVAMVLLWFAMLIVQPVLIGRKQFKLHRLVGKASYILVPLVVISCLLMTRNEQMREKNLIVFTANIVDISIFIFLYTLAINYKRKTSWHTRFMILTALPFISPAAARLHFNGLAIELSIILGLLIIERFNRKIYIPYLIALLIFFTFYIVLGGLLIFKPEVLDSAWKLFFNKV